MCNKYYIPEAVRSLPADFRRHATDLRRAAHPEKARQMEVAADKAERALAQHSEPGRGECGWSLDDEGCYHTDCGKEFEMVDFLTLKETSMKYCSNCGRRIRDDGRMGDA